MNTSGKTDPLPANVTAALRRGSAIEAVKLLREARGIGLRDALAAIAQHAAEVPGAVRKTPAAAPMGTTADKAKPAEHAVVRSTGPKLAPGEVARSSAGTRIAFVVIAGALLYHWLSA